MADEWNQEERRSVDKWDQEERRSDYCPVHHIKCQQWHDTEAELKNRVPIWIFKLTVTILIIVLSSMNVYFARLSAKTLSIVDNHITVSNGILKQMSRKVRENSLNQGIVMESLDLPRRNIPNYYGED